MRRLARRGGTRTMALMALLIVFVCGALVGYLLPHTPIRRVRTLVVRPGVEQFNALGLDATQRRRIDSILTLAQPHTDSLMQRLLPELRTYVDSVDLLIRHELTPAQQLALDSLRARSAPARLAR